MRFSSPAQRSEVKLPARIPRVNGSYDEAELHTPKARCALREFAKVVTEARKAFAAAGGVRAWLAFYHAKEVAYAKLVVVLPQVAAIPEFWRYVQNMAVARWLPIVEAQLAQISHSRSLCQDCDAVEVTWPSRRCAQCQEARRRETYRNAKERKRIKEQERKCAACHVEPLGPRQRVCFKCKTNRRSERNRRYQKSLKDDNLRRVQSNSPKEKTSTICGSPISPCLAQNVEPEAVLTPGLGMDAGNGELHAPNQPEHSAMEVTR